MHCSNWCSLNKIKASSLFFLKDKFASSLMHGERWHGGCCAALAMRATDRRNRKVVRVPAPHRDMLTLKKKKKTERRHTARTDARVLIVFLGGGRDAMRLFVPRRCAACENLRSHELAEGHLGNCAVCRCPVSFPPGTRHTTGALREPGARQVRAPHTLFG